MHSIMDAPAKCEVTFTVRIGERKIGKMFHCGGVLHFESVNQPFCSALLFCIVPAVLHLITAKIQIP